MSDAITQNRISLRKLKVDPYASDESLCFFAIVLFDGQPVANARNGGRGGCTLIDAVEGAAKRLAEAETFAKSLPAVTSRHADDEGAQELTIAMDLEYLVDLLANELHLRAAFNRDLANRPLFIKDGKLLYLKGVRYARLKDRHALFQSLRQEHGAEVILAELPRDEAFALWKKHSVRAGLR